MSCDIHARWGAHGALQAPAPLPPCSPEVLEIEELVQPEELQEHEQDLADDKEDNGPLERADVAGQPVDLKTQIKMF